MHQPVDFAESDSSRENIWLDNFNPITLYEFNKGLDINDYLVTTTFEKRIKKYNKMPPIDFQYLSPTGRNTTL